MSFDYVIEEMMMVRARPPALMEAAAENRWWGGEYVGFPRGRSDEVVLVRGVTHGVAVHAQHRRRVAGLMRGVGASLDDIARAMAIDRNVLDHRRVWVVLVAKAENPTNDQIKALHETSLYCWWECGHYLGFVYPSLEEARQALRRANALRSVINADGEEVDYPTARAAMDPDLRAELEDRLMPCPRQDFFDAYCEAHREKFGEEFIYARGQVPE